MTDQIPPWGCPWHGLITAGKLELPNGAKIDMRQPDSGNTSIIDFGAPEVLNQPPIETGKQWWNKAILSGDQIHGQPIGGSWVYQSPDLSLWLVSTTLHGTDGTASSITVTLDSFGKFGFKKVTHTYTVPMVDLSVLQDEFYDGYRISDQIRNVKVDLCSVHPQGKAAFFVVSSQFKPAAFLEGFIGYAFKRGNIAFIEIEIEGDADDCVVTLNRRYSERSMQSVYSGVINDSSQAIDYALSFDQTISDTRVESPPLCSGSYSFIESVSISGVTSGFDNSHTEIDRCIVSVFYNEKGESVPITLSARSDRSVQSSATVDSIRDKVYTFDVASNENKDGCIKVNEFKQAGLYSVTVTTSRSSVFTAAVFYGDVPVFESSASTSHVEVTTNTRSNNSLTGLGTEDAGGVVNERTSEYTAGVAYGDYFSESFVGDEAKNRTGFLNVEWHSPFYRLCYLDGAPGVPSGVGRFMLGLRQTSNNTFSFVNYRSASLSGFDPNVFPMTATVEPVITTPEGGMAAPELTYTYDRVPPITGPNTDIEQSIYASFNPITKEVSRTLDTPICYT